LIWHETLAVESDVWFWDVIPDLSRSDHVRDANEGAEEFGRVDGAEKEATGKGAECAGWGVEPGN